MTYGSFDYHASTTMIGGTDRRSGVGALVTFVEKAGDTYRDDGEFSLNELSVKTRWDIDPCTWIALNGFSWREEHQLVGRLTTDQLEQDRWQNPWPREIDWNGYAYGFDLTAHRDLNRSSWVELQGYYRLAHRALDSPRPSNGPPFDTVRSADSDNYNLGVELRGESTIPTGRVCNRLHWGLRYHQEWIDRLVFTEPIDDEGGDDKTYSQDATVRTHALSAYADDEITVGRFTVGVGARLEWVPDSYGKDDISGNSRSFEYFDVFPGVSASYQVGCNGAVFANYHQSFRAPQTWAYDFENRDQDMDFENGQNAELGFRWEDWKGFDGNLVFWYVDFSDFLDYDDLTETYANLGGYESYGVDLTLDADLGYLARPLSGWSVFGSVTRQTSKFTEGEFDGNHAPHVPDWIFSGGTRYQHRSGLYGVLETSYWDGGYITGENVETTDGYWLFDMRLGWRKQFCVSCLDVEVDLGLAAKNLFDNEYELQHRPGQWVPGAPRELFLDLSIGIDL